jgi:ribosomal-protein-alanine N-acetyltransferase
VKTCAYRIVPMARAHCKACDAIAAASDPWKTLEERIDFSNYIALKQAYVCIAQDMTAGFLIFTPEPVFARGGYLRAIGVAPLMRRLGLGSALLSFAERKTARVSRNLYLCVSSFNRPAQAFYKRKGYTRAGKLPDLIKQGEAEYIYWKRLRP